MKLIDPERRIEDFELDDMIDDEEEEEENKNEEKNNNFDDNFKYFFYNINLNEPIYIQIINYINENGENGCSIQDLCLKFNLDEKRIRKILENLNLKFN